MSRKIFVRLSLSMTLLAFAITFTPSAEAGCWYGRTITRTYYVYTYNDIEYICEGYVVAPPPHQMVIGESVSSDCDSSFYSWGDTTSCPNLYHETIETCGPVCD